MKMWDRVKSHSFKGFWREIVKNKISYLFIFPYVSLFFVFVVLPVLVSLFYSFTSFNILEPPKFIALENYIRMFFKDSIFFTAIKNTILLSVILGPGSYILCLFVAWFANELSPKLRALVTLFFYAPSISGNVYLIWTVLFASDDYGYANSLLTKLGLIQKPIMWLQDTRYIMVIVIIVSLWVSLGTSFLSFIAGFQGIDKSYYEAAAIDGIRNRWQELWFVTLPLIKPQMMFSAVMSISSAFSVGPLITNLAGYPTTDYSAQTIMNHLVDYGSIRFEMGYASSIATILFFMMISFNFIARKLIGKIGS